MMPKRIKNTGALTAALLLGMLFFLCSGPLPQEVGPQERMWQQGFFRIIYTTEGPHAVREKDENGNGVPDFVEDLALQFTVSHHIFCDIAGFRSPLLSPRYPYVRFVDVYVYNREKLKGNSGLAFQSSRKAWKSDTLQLQALNIHIARDAKVTVNATPAHEYFHLVQNGMTRLTNGWYFEGMARWAEDAVDKRPLPEASREAILKLLTTPEGREALQAVEYGGANVLWKPLAALCPSVTVELGGDDALLRAQYVDGSPVLKDHVFAGALLMRNVLESFSTAGDIPIKQYTHGNWGKHIHAPLNERFMQHIIWESFNMLCPQRGETIPAQLSTSASAGA